MSCECDDAFWCVGGDGGSLLGGPPEVEADPALAKLDRLPLPPAALSRFRLAFLSNTLLFASSSPNGGGIGAGCLGWSTPLLSRS